MARIFASASSQRIDLNTTLGNWEYTQAWTLSVWIKSTSNAFGLIIAKQGSSSPQKGWGIGTQAGGTSPTFIIMVRNDGTHEINQVTSNEFTTGTWRHLCVTYSGSGTKAGLNVYVDNVLQTTTGNDNLAGNSITNALATQIGCWGGTGAPGSYLNASLRRLLLYSAVISSGDRTTLQNGTSVPTTSPLVLWQEFGPLNDGVKWLADWSEGGNVGTVTGATYSATDPSITAATPSLGTSGGKTLSGPLTKYASNPILQNLGWVGGANTGVGDKIGPGCIIKNGPGDYRAWLENDTGGKTLDVGNQGGAFDFDTPTIYGTSTDGYTWTLSNQNVPASAIFSCNNLSGDATFKAAVKGETSLSSILYDTDTATWKAWFHGGNNSGTRKIYYATCTGDPSGANWTVQNGGVAVVTVGASGAWDDSWLSDAKVVRRSNALYVMLYRGNKVSTGIGQIGQATSTDGGLTWTKYASNPVIAIGAAGAWDAPGITTAKLVFDNPTGLYCAWYGVYAINGAGGSGFAYSSDAQTWTKGLFNPVMSANVATSGTSTFENTMPDVSYSYLDGTTYRHMYGCENGVSGVTGFRGQNEASNIQIVKAAPGPFYRSQRFFRRIGSR